jgi:hypothetical protein
VGYEGRCSDGMIHFEGTVAVAVAVDIAVVQMRLKCLG